MPIVPSFEQHESGLTVVTVGLQPNEGFRTAKHKDIGSLFRALRNVRFQSLAHPFTKNDRFRDLLRSVGVEDDDELARLEYYVDSGHIIPSDDFLCVFDYAPLVDMAAGVVNVRLPDRDTDYGSPAIKGIKTILDQLGIGSGALGYDDDAEINLPCIVSDMSAEHPILSLALGESPVSSWSANSPQEFAKIVTVEWVQSFIGPDIAPLSDNQYFSPTSAMG